MKILTIDIGTGTQDIYLYDSRLDLENGFKLVVPSPTMIVRQRLQEATQQKKDILLTGVTMGGGPSQWAMEDHIRAGLAVYATPDAARTFNDDLTVVEEMGVRVIGDEEANRLGPEIQRIKLLDFDFDTIQDAFARFNISLDNLAAVGVAVFDHGNAPPNYSDRQFRFDYLDQRIRAENRLSAFAYPADDVPEIMTRLEAVVRSAREARSQVLKDIPLVVMDTAPAAILGARLDPIVAERERVLITNVGNFHTLAFRLGPTGIEGVFEHHTGLLDVAKLDRLLRALADGSLTHEYVFQDHGHGALVYDPKPLSLARDSGVVVTGPRRNMMRASNLYPYFAVPFGDMMIAGCFGLLAAVGDILPEMTEVIRKSLREHEGLGTAPWDI